MGVKNNGRYVKKEFLQKIVKNRMPKINGKYQSFCGNFIIEANQECDDDNNIQNDCQYSCPLNCSKYVLKENAKNAIQIITTLVQHFLTIESVDLYFNILNRIM
ncbi:unnamed protein product [Paramecium octaurelia]|uniref:Uncharacterized protein n=1 Tax=Paramecium octaurelia TaxID=43137 RepID=A0A8S1ST73_PAROT|nr:unnamed protein product [Paramecium octaurelia]